MIIPGRRTYLLLILGVAIAPILAIVFNQIVSLIVTGLFDFILLSLMAMDGWRVRSHRVKVTRYPLGRLSIGRDNPVILAVQSADVGAQVLIRDSYPVIFAVSQGEFLASLAAKTSQELTYTIFPNQRGEFQWGAIQVRQLGFWGLAWYQWQIPASQTVAIYPDLMGLRSLSIRLSLQSTGSIRQVRRLGIGTEFAELREYRSGDDTRLIDWKSTARRRSPMVRVLEPEQEQTLIILLDRGRLMTARVEGLKRFDWGLNATLSLALAGLHRGDRVGVGVFDREVHTWISPERGSHQFPKLLDRLTPIQPVLLEPDYVAAVTTLVKQQTRRALVVVITDLVDATASAELLNALARLTPRYLPFCVTLRDPKVDAIAHTAHPEISAAYNRSVALDLLAQRQVAFASLKQKGVLILDATCDRISDQLIERYLQIKARNQL